mgnify:CR=1 FL=1
MSNSLESEDFQPMLLVAYADLWAHYNALIRAIGLSGLVNDGRLAVDAQILLERDGRALRMEARERFASLLAKERVIGKSS